MTANVVATHPVQAALDAQHAQIDAALERVTSADGAAVRDLLHAYDRLVGILSRHLLAVEVAICPEVAARLREGGHEVRVYMTESRRMESTMRRIQQIAFGDALAPRVPVDSLREQLVAVMASHRVAEQHLLELLEPTLAAVDREAIAHRLVEAAAHAPTRPHPHAVRRVGWTRLLYRPVATFDRFLDAIGSRTLPEVARRDPRRPGRWASYLLGQQLPPDDDR